MPKIKELLENVEDYKKCLEKRKMENLIPKFEEGIEKYKVWKEYNLQLQKLREKLNKLSIEYQKAEKKEQLLNESKELKNQIKTLEEKVKVLGEEVKRIELLLPNWLTENVPLGVGDELEKPIRYIGLPKVFEKYQKDFEQKHPGAKYETITYEPFHHYNLVGKLIDQEKAGNITTSRFYYLFDELVLLDLAIAMYAIEFFKNKGYADRLMITPYMIRKDVEEKITYFEAFEDTIFSLDKENLLLIPSSEHTILAYYKNTIFNQGELPLRIMAFSACFRREAGAHGKDTKGIFRVKQFHKVELHSIVKKDEDLKEVDKITKDVQEFLLTLGLPNRAVIVPSGDMDKRALIQIDVETWFPAEGRYRETHSIATLGTWVSEKLGLRYRLPKGEKELTRNVYATAVAVERLICAIAENHYDTNTKTIKIPEPLQKYMEGIKEIQLANKNSKEKKVVLLG
jgi:seryl-tRNA synthetase